jgi:hypothetical protein
MRPAKITATNESNSDDVKSFDSLKAAVDFFGVNGHSTIQRYLASGKPLKGYVLKRNETEVQTQAQTEPLVIENDEHDVFKEFTFFEGVEEMFKGQKIRFTKRDVVKTSVYDIIKVVTGTSNPHMTYSRMQGQYPQVLSDCENLQFPGSGERPTPVCTIEKMIEIINVLPGERAARFRSAGAKILIRVLGGDPILIDEIRDNAAKMEVLCQVENHPMNMFQLPKGLDGANAKCSLMLSPNMQDKTVADFRQACTYIIVFKYQDQVAIKFGSTENLKERVKEHYRTYDDMRLCYAQNCNNIVDARKTDRLFKDKMIAWLNTIKLDKKQGGSRNSTEILLGVSP